MTNYKSAFGKVCRIKNRQYSKSMPILNSAYFTECRRHIVIPCGKVCRIKNRHTFRILPILNSAYFKSMPILNSSYHAVKYAELRIGSILKVCRFVIRHITQTETQTETEANFTHVKFMHLLHHRFDIWVIRSLLNNELLWFKFYHKTDIKNSNFIFFHLFCLFTYIHPSKEGRSSHHSKCVFSLFYHSFQIRKLWRSLICRDTSHQESGVYIGHYDPIKYPHIQL